MPRYTRIRARRLILLWMVGCGPSGQIETPRPDASSPAIDASSASDGGTEDASSGNTVYVNGSTGSDSNPGTQNQPWKTIQKAANTAGAGQTISVAAGNYGEIVNVTYSGTSNAPIVFLANGTVVLRSFQVSADYVTIHGFEITDPTSSTNSGGNGHGIYLIGHYDTLENNYIHDTSWGGIMLFANTTDPTQTGNVLVQNNRIVHVGQLGIEVRGRNNTVQYNDISATMQYVPWITNPPSWADADGMHFHGSGHVFRGNKIHDILYTQPENPNPHIDCFQTFYSSPSQEAASNILFDSNSCLEPTQNTSQGLAAKLVQADQGSSLTFTNNVVYAYLGGIVKNASGVSFLNNTFVAPPDGTDGQGLQFINETNITIYNNVFANQTNGIGAIWPDSTSKASLVAGYDCLWNQGNSTSYPGDVVGKDPLFVNPPSDFHLQAGSPCADHGMVVNVNHDMDGNPRPLGAGFDIGAYER